MSSIATVTDQSASSHAAASSSASSGTIDTQQALASNKDLFLKLLTTQLQNQDPTSPMDTSQFTSQLVQYSSVEQQIQTNSKLTSLLQLTQGTELVQSSGLLGRKVEVSSDTMPLQNGQAALRFQARHTGPVDIVVNDASGRQVASAQVHARAGSNDWSWDGAATGGGTLPDGNYTVVVSQNNPDGTATSISPDVIATATGVTSDGSNVSLRLGTASVDFTALRAVNPSEGAQRSP